MAKDYDNLRVEQLGAAHLRTLARQLAARADRKVTLTDALIAAIRLADAHPDETVKLLPHQT